MGSEKACAFLSHTARDSSWAMELYHKLFRVPSSGTCLLCRVDLSATGELFLASVAIIITFIIHAFCVVRGDRRTTLKNVSFSLFLWVADSAGLILQTYLLFI